MINEKKLIKEFRKSHVSFNGTPMEESGMLISYRSIMRVINNQPKVGEWIPASNPPKRLKKEIVREVIVMHHGQATTASYVIPYNVFVSKYGQDITGEVKWWQPLPEPYKEGKNEL